MRKIKRGWTYDVERFGYIDKNTKCHRFLGRAGYGMRGQKDVEERM